jgi:hypothetical protein
MKKKNHSIFSNPHESALISLQGHFSLIVAAVDGYMARNIYLDDGKTSNYLD